MPGHEARCPKRAAFRKRSPKKQNQSQKIGRLGRIFNMKNGCDLLIAEG
jgi:hypothetical protein